MHGETVKISA